ncbi:MAG: helix-turn-helix domain-containing protein [Kutzneria sp.]|nr:helix-turn-helix domain-containing protein [Kutzneria sp.]MBV9843794.1 helix-turn-helix domain-containing protein [Kutzneria sp.]
MPPRARADWSSNWCAAGGTRRRRAYCEYAGNKSAAVATAHLSRTAYYQQMSRIEAVLGMSLSDPESMLSLHVALLAIEANDG